MVWMAERKKESPAGTMGRKALAAAPSWRGLLLFSRLEAGDGIPKNIVVAGAGGVKAPGEEGRGFPEEEEEDEAVGTIEAAGAIAAIALRSLKVGPAPPRPALSSLCPSPLSSYSHVKQLLVAGERGGYKVTVAVHWGHWRWSCPEEREQVQAAERRRRSVTGHLLKISKLNNFRRGKSPLMLPRPLKFPATVI